MKKSSGHAGHYSPTGKPTSGPHGSMGPKSGANCCSASGNPTGGKNTGKVA